MNEWLFPVNTSDEQSNIQLPLKYHFLQRSTLCQLELFVE